MIIILTIFQYLIAATVDLMDKFLITARKIEPVSYTFYTVVMGAALLLIWPWVYQDLPSRSACLAILSGAFFSLTMYVFFKALSEGEVSRVVPFVFGLVPVTDILISLITGRNLLTPNQGAAVFLLIPGALLVSMQRGKFLGRHVGLKILSAFLFSSYYFLWQYASISDQILNSLMWNRAGGALVLVLLLAVPSYRKKVFDVSKIKHKTETSLLFLFKQALGGVNFIFFSFLLALPGAKIPVINSLQGFRYVFLLLLAFLLSKRRRHFIEEDTGKAQFFQKVVGIGLIFLGTIFLFI